MLTWDRGKISPQVFQKTSSSQWLQVSGCAWSVIFVRPLKLFLDKDHGQSRHLLYSQTQSTQLVPNQYLLPSNTNRTDEQPWRRAIMQRHFLSTGLWGNLPKVEGSNNQGGEDKAKDFRSILRWNSWMTRGTKPQNEYLSDQMGGKSQNINIKELLEQHVEQGKIIMAF